MERGLLKQKKRQAGVGGEGVVSAILLSQKLEPCHPDSGISSIHPSIHPSLHPLNVQETGPYLRPSIRSWANMRRVLGSLPSAFLPSPLLFEQLEQRLVSSVFLYSCSPHRSSSVNAGVTVKAVRWREGKNEGRKIIKGRKEVSLYYV